MAEGLEVVRRRGLEYEQMAGMSLPNTCELEEEQVVS